MIISKSLFLIRRMDCYSVVNYHGASNRTRTCDKQKPRRSLPSRIDSFSYRSSIFLIVKGITVQFIKIQKLRKSHIKCQRDHVQRFHAGIFRQSSHDVIQCRLFHTAHRRQFIDSNSAALAKGAYAFYVNLRIIHFKIPSIIITRFRVKIMIIWDLDGITRIRVDFAIIVPLK